MDAEEQPSIVRQHPVIATLVLVALVAAAIFVPVPVIEAMDRNAAADVVDQADGGRESVLQRTASADDGLGALGEPVRSWSEVGCWLEPRLSDGDGETDVVVYYFQLCAPVVYQIYALPAGQQTLEDAAELLHGRLGHWDPECSEPIMDVVEMGLGAIDADGYSMSLQWVDPAGTTTRGDRDCSLPTPGEGHTTRTDEFVTGDPGVQPHVVFAVYGQRFSADIGCRRAFGWIGACVAQPDGAPFL